jgi:hypothetical protein
MDDIVKDWLGHKVSTAEASQLILKRLACSSWSMGAIMAAVDGLPEELIRAME